MAQIEDHWAYFGDGNAAKIIEIRENIDKDTGVKRTKFIFLPSKRIEETYDLKEEQDYRTGLIIREYDSTDVLFLERGVNRTRAWIFTDFDGKETIASRRHAELTEALNDTARLLRSNEAAKYRAFQELEETRTNMRQQLKQQIELIREVGKARGRSEMEDEDSGTRQEFSE